VSEEKAMVRTPVLPFTGADSVKGMRGTLGQAIDACIAAKKFQKLLRERKCPRCGRKILKATFDELAYYVDAKGRARLGVTVLKHGKGHRIGDTCLWHGDFCMVNGKWPDDYING